MGNEKIRKPQMVEPDTAFGKRVRARRQQLGMTLEDVAQKSGLGRSIISYIERDRGSPSIASVLKLCRALGLGLSDLFDERPSTLIRRSDRRQVDLGGHGFSDFSLTPRNSKHILATWTELAPGASAGPDFYSLEAEEELILVLDGELHVRFEDNEIIMQAGDALTLNPRQKRVIGNHLDDRKTTVVFVYAPPPF